MGVFKTTFTGNLVFWSIRLRLCNPYETGVCYKLHLPVISVLRRAGDAGSILMKHGCVTNYIYR